MRYLIVLFLLIGLSAKSQIKGDKGREAVFNKYKVAEGHSFSDEEPVLVKLNRPLTPAETESLKPLRRFSLDHFVIRGKLVKKLSGAIVYQAKINALWKASDKLAVIWEQNQTKNKLFTIRLAVDQSNSQLSEVLQSLKNYSIDHKNNVVTLTIQMSALLQLLQQDAVLFADLVPSAKEEIVISGNDLPTNDITAVHQLYPAINGNGVTVSLKEGLFDEKDLDLMGNIAVLPAKTGGVSSHATIMATLILGRGNTFIRGLGVAPAAKLSSSDFSNLLPDDAGVLKTLNVTVQNHSYGTDIDNIYGIEALAYDQQVFEADTLVHVFSAGNIGTSAPVSGLYTGLSNTANLTGNFKQAKNVLVVGGINMENISEPLSSKGPAYDGRVKPELVALGQDGTSGAAALTSGVVALLQQEYKKLFGKRPSASLVKSILVNSADDIGSPHVDYTTGFGKLNALHALQTVMENRFKLASISQDQDFSFPLSVAENQQEIKVTLSWNDPPAVINSAQSIVNHLDLSLETPAGTVILPWVLSSYPSTDSLMLAATRKTDQINTVQQISLDHLTAGNYTIHVKGKKVVQDKQDFSIAYQFSPVDYFNWTYPLKDDAIFSNEQNYLRWDSSFEGVNGKLSISYDNGSSWTVLTNNTPLNDTFFKWAAPDLFSTALLKMEINGKEFRSGSFVVSSPPVLNVGYNCTNKLMLYWKPQPKALSYTLYNLSDNILRPVAQLKDTLVVIDKSAISSPYFALSANGADFSGLKSYTTDYTAQAVSCYTRNLLGDVEGDAIRLSLLIGSTYQLKNITWEKQSAPGIFVPLTKAAVIPNQLNYIQMDDHPKIGIQFYRVTLETEDGNKILSDILPVDFLKSNDFVFYPNPVTSDLYVMSGDFKPFNLALYNISGQKVFNEDGTGQQQFNISTLSAGLYIGVISRNGITIKSIKVIKK